MWYGVEEEASVWLGRCLPVCTAVCVSSWTCTCLCVWRSATVSVSSWMDSCPFVWTTLQLSVTPTMHPAIRSSVCPAVCATVHLDVQPSIYLELQLSICPAGCATVHPSMFLAGQSPVCVSGWMWNCLCVQPDRHLSIQLSSHPCIQPYNCPCVQRDEQLTAGGHATVHVSICLCLHTHPHYPTWGTGGTEQGLHIQLDTVTQLSVCPSPQGTGGGCQAQSWLPTHRWVHGRTDTWTMVGVKGLIPPTGGPKEGGCMSGLTSNCVPTHAPIHVSILITYPRVLGWGVRPGPNLRVPRTPPPQLGLCPRAP